MPGPLFRPTTESMYDRLPDVYRDLDKEQDNPVPLPEIPALINYATNPRPANLTGWYNASAVNTMTLDNGRVKLVFNGAAGTSSFGPPSEVIPVQKGDRAWLTFKYQGPGGAAGTPAVIVHQRDAANGIVAQNVIILPNTPVETTITMQIDVTSELVTTLYLAQLAYGPDTQPNGATHYFRDVLFTKHNGSSAPEFFSGNTTKTNDPRYGSLWSWEGTVDLSRSIQQGFAADPGGYPLKRFLSSVVDQVDEIAELYRRFKYVTPDAGGAADSTSELVDPHYADDAWLSWLAQMMGAQGAITGMTPAEVRALLHEPTLAYGAGTPAAIAAAAQKALTGTKYVTIYNHTTNVSSIGGAGQWDVLVATRSSETASGAAVLKAIKDAGAKPAGIVLWHRNFETTWANLEATYTTWAAIDALPNWTRLEETGL